LEVKLDNIEAFEMMSSEASDTQTSHFLMERDMESNMVYNQLIKRRLPTENDMKFYKSGRSPISPGAEQSALFEAFVQLMPPSTKELEVVVELELRELIIMVSPAAHWVKSISSFFKLLVILVMMLLKFLLIMRFYPTQYLFLRPLFLLLYFLIWILIPYY
jgi:hypothetical protein